MFFPQNGYKYIVANFRVKVNSMQLPSRSFLNVVDETESCHAETFGLAN